MDKAPNWRLTGLDAGLPNRKLRKSKGSSQSADSSPAQVLLDSISSMATVKIDEVLEDFAERLTRRSSGLKDMTASDWLDRFEFVTDAERGTVPPRQACGGESLYALLQMIDSDGIRTDMKDSCKASDAD